MSSETRAAVEAARAWLDVYPNLSADLEAAVRLDERARYEALRGEWRAVIGALREDPRQAEAIADVMEGALAALEVGTDERTRYEAVRE